LENSKTPKAMAKKIFTLIEKDKILLLQDKSFPNVISKITGETIAGSWWGHPMGNPIYNGLQWLHDNHPVLVIKLVSGKVTYVHESLFADLYTILREPRDWQIKKLTPDDLKLLKYISKKKKVASDDSKLADLVKDPKKSLANLEKSLVVSAEEEHTESGKHVKIFAPWSESKIFSPRSDNYEAALQKIENIVSKLSTEAGAKVKLPWTK
jgi:hypothetical protein